METDRPVPIDSASKSAVSRIVTVGYIAACWALGALALLGGAGPGDLFPGLAFLVLATPVSWAAVAVMSAGPPEAAVFGWAFVLLTPPLNLLLFRLVLAGLRRLGFHTSAGTARGPGGSRWTGTG